MRDGFKRCRLREDWKIDELGGLVFLGLMIEREGQRLFKL